MNEEEKKKAKSVFSSDIKNTRILIASIRSEFEGKNIFEYEEKFKEIEPQLKTAEIMIDTLEVQLNEIPQQGVQLDNIENITEKEVNVEIEQIEQPKKKKKKCLIM